MHQMRPVEFDDGIAEHDFPFLSAKGLRYEAETPEATLRRRGRAAPHRNAGIDMRQTDFDEPVRQARILACVLRSIDPHEAAGLSGQKEGQQILRYCLILRDDRSHHPAATELVQYGKAMPLGEGDTAWRIGR